MVHKQDSAVWNMFIDSAGYPVVTQQKLFDLGVASRNQNNHSHSVVAALVRVCAYNCKSYHG